MFSLRSIQYNKIVSKNYANCMGGGGACMHVVPLIVDKHRYLVHLIEWPLRAMSDVYSRN